jgi:hypothetical protein
VTPPAPERDARLRQGHPRAIFQRAIERGNLLVAETTLREIGRVTLTEALQLTALIAVKVRGATLASRRAGSRGGSRNATKRRSMKQRS